MFDFQKYKTKFIIDSGALRRCDHFVNAYNYVEIIYRNTHIY